MGGTGTAKINGSIVGVERGLHPDVDAGFERNVGGTLHLGLFNFCETRENVSLVGPMAEWERAFIRAAERSPEVDSFLRRVLSEVDRLRAEEAGS